MTSNQNSDMPYLRNEFSKIFYGPFYDDDIYKNDSTIYDQTKN